MAAGGKTFTYDSQNELVAMNGGTVQIVYDGDGNRVAKSVNGVVTRYLVDDLNPTGLPQAMDELNGSGVVTRTYTYGLQRISEDQIVNSTWVPSFYSYDGGGSVRQLTSMAGAVTDSYEYDAFGNLLNSTGTTPNVYRYRGEAYDSDLGLYYLRARWMNPLTGRFMSRDPNAGKPWIPPSLHKYLYASGDPVDLFDASGRAASEETGLTFALLETRPLPALIEFAGGAMASAASTAVGWYSEAAESAATAQAAVANFIEAVDWVTLAKGVTKVFLCEGLELTMDQVIDRFLGEGASSVVIPSQLSDAFQEACFEFAGRIPGL